MRRHTRTIPDPIGRLHEASRAIEAAGMLLCQKDDIHAVSGHALASLLLVIREEMEEAIDQMEAVERRLTAV